MFRAPCAHRQEVKIVLYNLLYHHTETSEWSKFTKIYKYEHIVVKITTMCSYLYILYINKMYKHEHIVVKLLLCAHICMFYIFELF